MIKHLLQQVLKKCASIRFCYFSFLKALEWVIVFIERVSFQRDKGMCGVSKYQRATSRTTGTPVSQFTS